MLGIAGAGNDEWLLSVGVEPINHGDGLAGRLRDTAPEGIDAVLDCYGGGYVDEAITLGVPAQRIVTIIDFAAAAKHDTKTVHGSEVATATILAELAGMIQVGELTIPIAATYPLDDVHEAYTRLAKRHTRGKIVLRAAT